MKIRTFAEMFLAGDLKCKDCGRLLHPSVPVNSDGTVEIVDIPDFGTAMASDEDGDSSLTDIFRCDRCPPGADLLCGDCIGTIKIAPSYSPDGQAVEFVCSQCVEDDETFVPWRSH